MPDPSKIEPGDVFLRGGFPGHAVIVLDVAADETGARAFLLGQSFMPAQQIHVLKNPAGASIWYEARASGPLVTPEWKFNYTDLRRFASGGPPPPQPPTSRVPSELMFMWLPPRRALPRGASRLALPWTSTSM